MTECEMFEKSFQRPTDFFTLTSKQQWQIDKQLGILDWEGNNLSTDDLKRFKDHYQATK